ncbi:MAG: hypothetical protein A3H71_03690 [Candidatus Sungbacteria bacterium RIFCSPLOWO2_02_FULL_48_13b]|uniref:Uncharacterized protein n=1 Tax=Candidatus Sungbacteria bacterium RIFCSPLOWO2_02_FULL_48_13b TaxID=1802283 RepID=A0A1G2LDI3_9BACT|nr:MAG: hypothetical protein A3H71_03690 [Candidatus Sungbacteria bacterium RIFCSPLOWO2_02_FULL_48_13b]
MVLMNPIRSSLAEVLRTRALGASETSNGVNMFEKLLRNLQLLFSSESRRNFLTEFMKIKAELL